MPFLDEGRFEIEIMVPIAEMAENKNVYLGMQMSLSVAPVKMMHCGCGICIEICIEKSESSIRLQSSPIYRDIILCTTCMMLMYNCYNGVSMFVQCCILFDEDHYFVHFL